MRLAPYTGKPRTLRTHLSEEECLRRLREEVITPWPLAKRSGWQPFQRHLMRDRDYLVFRKVEDRRLWVRLEAGRGNNSKLQWLFSGERSSSENGTQMTGHYHLARWSYISWYFLHLFASMIVVFSAIALFAALGEPETDWRAISIIALILVMGPLLPLRWRPKQEHVQQDERYIVESLKKLLEAQEIT